MEQTYHYIVFLYIFFVFLLFFFYLLVLYPEKGRMNGPGAEPSTSYSFSGHFPRLSLPSSSYFKPREREKAHISFFIVLFSIYSSCFLLSFSYFPLSCSCFSLIFTFFIFRGGGGTSMAQVYLQVHVFLGIFLIFFSRLPYSLSQQVEAGRA